MSYWETSGKSNEWFTPPHVFEALGCAFDQDVAAGVGAAVPAATKIFSRSLEADWSGFVWMNPPFGGRNGLTPWLDKFIAHGNGIALTPDRTSAPWFQSASVQMDALLFTPKLRFLRPDGSEGESPSNGTALMAIGSQGTAALFRAASLGLGQIFIPALRSRAA